MDMNEVIKKICNDKKPPIGIEPCYIAAGNRINALSEAIMRHSDSVIKYYSYIRKWSEEIQQLCDMVEFIDDND